jgi:hypothetical protein
MPLLQKKIQSVSTILFVENFLETAPKKSAHNNFLSWGKRKHLGQMNKICEAETPFYPRVLSHPIMISFRPCLVGQCWPGFQILYRATLRFLQISTSLFCSPILDGLSPKYPKNTLQFV